MSHTTTPSGQSEREWWLRSLLVLASPRRVFAALRDDSDAAAEARQEPLTAIVLLTGVGGVLATSIAGRLFDDPEFDALLVGVWAIVGGAIYGIGAYFGLGALVYLGASFAGGLGSYRRARHVLGFASVPLVLSLLVQAVRIALYGRDALRTGGADTGLGNDVFRALETTLVLWALALLVVGVRTVHGWTWSRAVAGSALPLVLVLLVLARAHGLV